MPAPTSAAWNGMVQTFALCTAFLYSKYFFSQMYGMNDANHPQEDADVLGTRLEAPPGIQRKERQFANDLENIPMHLSIFWAAFIVQNYVNASNKGEQTTTALTCLIVIYTALRTTFTICYIFRLQPYRTLAFVLGNFCVFGASAILIAAAFQLDMSTVFPANGPTSSPTLLA